MKYVKLYKMFFFLLFRIDNTRQICSLLQNHCNQLSGTLQRCITEKEILKNVYDDQMKEIDELAQKYTNLNEQYIGDVEQLKTMGKMTH